VNNFRCLRLPADEGATYVDGDARRGYALTPMITLWHQPSMGMHRSRQAHPQTAARLSDPRPALSALDKALRYMDLEPGVPLLGHKIDLAFFRQLHQLSISIYGCAGVLKGQGRTGVRLMVVPGSQQVKQQAGRGTARGH